MKKQIKVLAYRGVKSAAADERPLVALFARKDSRGGRTIPEWFQFWLITSTRKQIQIFKELARIWDMDEIHVRLRDEDPDGFTFPHEHLVTIQYRPDAPEGEQWTFKKAILSAPGEYKTLTIDDLRPKEA